MKLFPAIDILEGRAVRLLYGKKENVTDYGDPVDQAKRFFDCGAKRLHVVDLSGAFGEDARFNGVLEKIVALGLPVQSGGGLRSAEAIRARFLSGASRAVLGTICLEQPEVFARVVEEHGDKIVVGIDAKNGKIAVRGWTELSCTDAFAFGKHAKALGVCDTVFTDISRDGALTGVNVEETVRMGGTGLNVIASGGVRNMDDLYKLKEQGVYGAVLGRALYTGDISLARAIGEME